MSENLAEKQPNPADPSSLSPLELARKIDHTLLKADARRQDIERLCQEARENGFATVCVASHWIPLATELLMGCATVPIAVVGFPLGSCLSSVKAFEAREAIRLGAREIDMVLAIGALKNGESETVREDIRQVVAAATPYPVKVILETSLLSDAEKALACRLAVEAGAAFVKTSTGFSSGGATVEDIRLLRETVGPKIGVKASGGIRTRADALALLAAGADRIGASASVAIVKNLASEAGKGY
jgi:deoxyribose-phosphate aldolase